MKHTNNSVGRADPRNEGSLSPKGSCKNESLNPASPEADLCPVQEPQKRGKGCCGFIALFVILALLVVVALFFLKMYIRPPMARSQGRKEDNATILLAGTDESGINTDTLMLINFNSSRKQISIMSIPRDTKVNSTYRPHKINGAYSANGQGEQGMEALCDYVSQCVGILPDGYVLLDLDCFVQVVDLLGGVTFDVPVSMHYDDPTQDLHIHLEPGTQHLDGKEAVGLVRFRKGYALQDLERISVQRDFILSAMKQWLAKKDYTKLYEAFTVLRENSLTNMSASNFLWMAECVYRWGMENCQTMTIPYTIGESYVYIKESEELLELINVYFNPYRDPVVFEDLNIAKP